MRHGRDGNPCPTLIARIARARRAIGWALVAATAGCPAHAPRLSPAPNVLVVLLDDVGTDKLGAYGEHPHPAHTPHLDALASAGVLFRNAWSTPTCSPARGALVTGRFGRRYGLGGNVTLEGGEAWELPLDEVTLAEIAPGVWQAAEVGKWHLASYESASGLDAPAAQGFSTFRAMLGNLRDPGVQLERQSYYSWEKDADGEIAVVERYATTDQIDDALALTEAMAEPWLLYLPLTAAHAPLVDPPDDLAGPNRDIAGRLPRLYHRTVEAADAELGRLFTSIDLERTLVFVVGDNGTPSDAVLPPRLPAEAKLTMNEGGINVPFVVAGPGVARGRESDALVSVVDVVPTLAELAGVPLARPVDGHSLAPLLADPDAPGPDYVYTEWFRHPERDRGASDERALRDRRWKYVVDDTTGEEHLFDLAGRDDDGPDLLAGAPSAEASAALERLRAELDRWRRTLEP